MARSTIKVCSYNCRGLKIHRNNNSVCNFNVETILQSYDVVLLQETLLFKEELPLLNNFNELFHGTGEAACSLSDNKRSGRPYGGVCVLWRKSIESVITELKFSLDWLVGINIKTNNSNITILCVYLPYCSAENEDDFLSKLSTIYDIITDTECENILVAGDFNANVKYPSSSFGRILIDFCEDSGLSLTTLECLPSESYTYVSESWQTTSWLDHLVCSHNIKDCISNLRIDYELCMNDHLPFGFEIQIGSVPLVDDSFVPTPTVKWGKLNPNQTFSYTCNSFNFLNSVYIPVNAVYCRSSNCSHSSHKIQLLKYYNDICNALLSAARPLQTIRRKHGRSRPGWNTFVRDAHLESKAASKAWCDGGRPRRGVLLDNKKRAHSKFKSAVRYIKRHEDKLKASSLAEKLLKGNPKEFWSDIQRSNGARSIQSANIGDITGESNIANFWGERYREQFNCLPPHVPFIIEPIQSVYDDSIVFTATEIYEAILSMRKDISDGPDQLHPEHLRMADVSLLHHLAYCFTSLTVHGGLPSEFMDLTISPIIKNKKGKISDPDNYRPIAKATVLSKVLETVLLEKMGPFLRTSDNQFGYKKGLSTDTCVLALKETIAKYKDKQSNVFVSFLDASRAFDRVCYPVLFKILHRRGVPIPLLRVLFFWYTNQEMKAKWGSSFSNKFRVSNGVKQGGVLSPFLFSCYLDDLSSRLESLNVGCLIGGMKVNHLCYADDIALIAPSTKGLQTLLDAASDMAKSYLST